MHWIERLNFFLFERLIDEVFCGRYKLIRLEQFDQMNELLTFPTIFMHRKTLIHILFARRIPHFPLYCSLYK